MRLAFAFRSLKSALFYPKFSYFVIYIFSVFLFCEFFIYYAVLMFCSWPSSAPSVRAMLLADPHLLGIRQGHWFDKLRREWQMYRTFQTAITYFEPNFVFILGDIFDEGQWSTPNEFASYIDRFHSIFASPSNVKLFVLPGNHDLGFHYGLIFKRIELFQKSFDMDLVKLVTIGDVNFVLINSMSLHNDGCNFCELALQKLKEINKTLNCAKHFPLFRKSDALCNELDQAPGDEKFAIFRESWDCLSESSTKMVLDLIQPRAVFSGHTHHGCLTFHTDDKIPEWTISSFSWRNKKSPAFLLVHFSNDSVDVSKCYMPNENTVLFVYIFCALFLLLWIFCAFFKRFRYLPAKNL